MFPTVLEEQEGVNIWPQVVPEVDCQRLLWITGCVPCTVLGSTVNRLELKPTRRIGSVDGWLATGLVKGGCIPRHGGMTRRPSRSPHLDALVVPPQVSYSHTASEQEKGGEGHQRRRDGGGKKQGERTKGGQRSGERSAMTEKEIEALKERP